VEEADPRESGKSVRRGGGHCGAETAAGGGAHQARHVECEEILSGFAAARVGRRGRVRPSRRPARPFSLPRDAASEAAKKAKEAGVGERGEEGGARDLGALVPHREHAASLADKVCRQEHVACDASAAFFVALGA